jgi:pimeloyl-ACP methyl ester carboxylesterase
MARQGSLGSSSFYCTALRHLRGCGMMWFPPDRHARRVDPHSGRSFGWTTAVSCPVELIEGIVDDVSRRLDEAGIQRAHLVGNSLGGWVALELARRGRACSVLAFAPAGAWMSAADLSRMERIFRVGAVLSRSKNIRWLLASGTARRLLLRGMAEQADRLTPAQAISALDDMAGCSVSADFVAGARESGPIAAFDRLPCPVRITWGHCDRTLPFTR